MYIGDHHRFINSLSVTNTLSKFFDWLFDGSRLIAYETIERIGSRDYLSYFCGIIPTDTNLRTKTNVTLEKVTITIQPKTTETIITLPIVADYNFLPADFSYNVSDGTVATIQEKPDIIVFGIRTLKPITVSYIAKT